MKVIYEGTIGGYSFQLVEDNIIEVWTSIDNERPESFIFIKEGSINSEKDFHYEIMAWVAKQG